MMSAPQPIGLLFLARTPKGLRYLEFMNRRSLKRVIAAHAEANPGATWEPSLLDLKQVTEQLESYFLGTLREFEIPLDPLGSEFQLKVWSALSRIPFGATRTYGDIAREVDQPKAARAVGLANHDNPVAIVVPCHRVIGANGSLTGYGGGVNRKRWLIEHEARHGRPAARPGDLFATHEAQGGRRGAR
jgi:methylated-DNA-[protein]-cysteine S-methyltransferase